MAGVRNQTCDRQRFSLSCRRVHFAIAELKKCIVTAMELRYGANVPKRFRSGPRSGFDVFQGRGVRTGLRAVNPVYRSADIIEQTVSALFFARPVPASTTRLEVKKVT